jgi:diguanylate cyclase (GGDEF)-like protein
MAPGFTEPAFEAARAADDERATALVRQTALADLARTALLGAQHRPLLEMAAQVVQGALDAETCGIYEYLPGGHDLLLRAAAFAPGPRRGLTTIDLTGSAPALPPDSNGSAPLTDALVVPIGVSPPFGCMAARAREHRGFDDDDRQFAVLAAAVLAAALERLLADEDQRLASLQDPLTGLPNRALTLDHLRLALARSQRRPSSVAVLFIDLDRFKLINDTLGHQAGDDLLIAVGHRLRTALRPPDTIGRLGGDEFVAVCEDVGGEADALAVAERLAATLEAPVRLAGRDLRIRASIGVALSVSDSTDPATLLAEADGAMFWAKRRGGRVALFDERMRVGTEDVMSPEERVAAGLAWSRPDSAIPGIRTSATAGRLLARMAEVLADIEDPERLDLRDLPAS